jgi:hypothetical protein
MPDVKRRSIALVVILFIVGTVWGASLLYLAFGIVREDVISWLDALAIHCLLIGYSTLFTLGNR